MSEPAKPRSARWSYAALGVALASAAAVALLGFTRSADDARVVATPPACAGVPADVAPWGPQARRALIARNPEAAASAAWLADVIDARVARWPAARQALCAGGGDRACLVDRLAELRAAAAASHETVEAVVARARALGDPAACAASTVERTRAAHGPVALAQIEDELRRLGDELDPQALVDYGDALLRKAELLAQAGQAAEAAASAAGALVVQERIYGRAHPALLRALAVLGDAQDALGHASEARATRTRAGAIGRPVP